ncbi:MAG: hypothetical protein R3E32_22170 [Chitinophagales bacterium]
MKHNLLFILFLTSLSTLAQPPTEVVNIYDYEKVIILELTANGNDWNIDVQKVCEGIPTKSLVSDRSITMNFMDEEGKELYSVSVSNPKLMQMHSESNAVPTTREFPASTTIVVPYSPKCVKVVCSKEHEANEDIEWIKSFDIQKAVQEAYETFVSQ